MSSVKSGKASSQRKSDPSDLRSVSATVSTGLTESDLVVVIFHISTPCVTRVHEILFCQDSRQTDQNLKLLTRYQMLCVVLMEQQLWTLAEICAKFGISPISPQSILRLDEQLIR